MNLEIVMQIVSELAMLPFYPSEPEARLAIVRLVGKMATNESQVRWLIDRMTSGLYVKWPGPAELRAVFCMKFKPADNIEAVSEIYPDGLTREQLNPGAKALPAATPLQLPPGEVTTDPEMKELVVACADATGMPSFAWAPPREWTELEPGETELQGLIRVTRGFGRMQSEPRAATDAEIAAIKQAQEANRRSA